MDATYKPFSFIKLLQAKEWHSLQTIAHTNKYKKNAYVFRANELNDALYVLLEGRVKITRLSPQGRELIQWFCLPGEIFGLSENNHGPHRGLYAQAITDTRLLCIQKVDFDQYLLSHPRIALLIIKQLASRLSTLGDLLLNMTSEDAHVRFIKLLQRLREFYGSEDQRGVHIDIYLTHQEMADMIGVCRQTVSSMIGQLKRRGIIDTDRSGIYIQSPAKLQTLSRQPETFFQSI